jgi:hypothetical protein
VTRVELPELRLELPPRFRAHTLVFAGPEEGGSSVTDPTALPEQFRPNLVITRSEGPVAQGQVSVYIDSCLQGLQRARGYALVSRAEAPSDLPAGATLVRHRFQNDRKQPVEQLQLYVPVKGEVLIATLTHLQSEFSSAEPEFRAILRSLTFLG